EVIIVNDGSTDNSPEVVSRYLDPRITLLSQDNMGVSSARNLGITKARYPWILFLDADDEWESNKMETIALWLGRCPRVCWGFSGYRVYRDHLYRSTKGSDSIYVIDNIFDELLRGVSILTSTV